MRHGAMVSILLGLLALASPAHAGAVRALFDLTTPEGGPFPSDRFTAANRRHITGGRVNLPRPDCVARPSDCADLDVINTLDGFSLQPRLSIPFSGQIDPASVSSETVFLVRLGDVLGGPGGNRIGVNQVVWDPATATLHAQADEFLEQHTRYLLVVTDGVLDEAGHPVEAGDFARLAVDTALGRTNDPALKAYRVAVLTALYRAGVPRRRIVSASLFTTQSITALLEKIRDRAKAATPAPADFRLGPGGSRTVFPLGSITSIVFTQQTGSAPSFTPLIAPMDRLAAAPGAVGTIAFGKYAAPDYQIADKTIPPIGTRTGIPAVQRINDIYFNVFLPSGPMPAGGWPVVIFGHGGNDHKNSQPFFVSAILASHGFATIGINSVGSGGGPVGTLTVNRSGAPPVTLTAGSRALDLDGDGTITPVEGLLAHPVQNIVRMRDSLRQTAADLLQLVRVIQVGIDVDGDGARDLDPSRMYYLGRSLGAAYGAAFLAVEPDVRAAALLVVPGSLTEVARLSPLSRSESFAGITGIGSLLAARTPPLINVGGLEFDENMPLRNRPPVINTVPGAMELQRYFDNAGWAQQAGDPPAYARHLRMAPLAAPRHTFGARRMAPKPILLQFGRGDQSAPNPTNTAFVRAGDLADVTTFFRNDLAVAADPTIPRDPHLIALRLVTVPQYARPAQEQVAAFLASDGTSIVDPDGSSPIFEVPIALPLPEDLGFIP